MKFDHKFPQGPSNKQLFLEAVLSADPPPPSTHSGGDAPAALQRFAAAQLDFHEGRIRVWR